MKKQTGPTIAVEDVVALIEQQWPASSVERAQEILRILTAKRHGETTRVAQTRVKTVTWRTILRLVCAFYDVTEEDLMSRCRQKRLAHARFALYAALSEFLSMNVSEIARIVHRDHTSVLYGLDSLDRESDQWQRLCAELAGMRFDLSAEDAA